MNEYLLEITEWFPDQISLFKVWSINGPSVQSGKNGNFKFLKIIASNKGPFVDFKYKIEIILAILRILRITNLFR